MSTYTKQDQRGWFRAQRDAINQIVEKINELHPDDKLGVIDWVSLKGSHMKKGEVEDDIMNDIIGD